MKVVFIHGSGGWGGVWKHQMEAFPDADAPTLPGHPKGEQIGSVEGYRDWLRGYLHARGYRGVVLAGHSLGGGIVLSYALAYPHDLKAIILVGTGARLRVNPAFLAELETAGRGDTAAWEKQLAERYEFLGAAFREDLLRRRREIGPAAELNDLRCCDKFDVMERLGEIRLPTLVIGGANDIMTLVKYHDYLADRIPGAKKIIIPGTTHYLFAEKPGEFNRAIQEFLAGL